MEIKMKYYYITTGFPVKSSKRVKGFVINFKDDIWESEEILLYKVDKETLSKEKKFFIKKSQADACVIRENKSSVEYYKKQIEKSKKQLTELSKSGIV